MTTNAQLIFDSINQYDDIRKLIGTQEDIFLDFKETRTNSGALLDDDKMHFSKAASGFAHQEGGVLVWGIEARKDQAGTDQAAELKPIPNVKAFLSNLNDYTKYSTDPVVDGILHKVIFDHDEKTQTHGFAISYFPRSDREHRSLGKTSADFYKRHGDSFSPLSTNDIRALFFRSHSPEVELVVTGFRPGDGGAPTNGTLNFVLRNAGRGIAKYPSALIGVSPTAGGMWYDGDGNFDFAFGSILGSHVLGFEKQFIPNAGIVIHPEQEISIAKLVRNPSPIVGIAYRCFAENMVPRTGKIDLR
jgi:hypothetical protein